MFESQVLFANILVPALVFSGSLFLAVRLTNGQRTGEKQEGAKHKESGDNTRRIVGSTIVILSSALVTQLAYGLRNGWSLWPQDAWERIPAATFLVAITAAFTELFLQPASLEEPMSDGAGNLAKPSSAASPLGGLGALRALGAWGVRIAALYFAAGAIFPSGESWLELQESRTGWLATITVSVAAAWFAISRLTQRVTPVVGFSLIPWTIAAAVLISQSFLKVTEPMLAIATVLGLSSLMDWFRPRSYSVRSVLGPLHFASAAAIAHGQFYNFLDIPPLVYFIAIAAPSIVALVALAVSYKSSGYASISALTVSVVLAGFILYRTLSA